MACGVPFGIVSGVALGGKPSKHGNRRREPYATKLVKAHKSNAADYQSASKKLRFPSPSRADQVTESALYALRQALELQETSEL